MSTENFSLLYTTFPNVDEAKLVAQKLLEAKMVSYLNIVPTVVTLYREDNAEEKRNTKKAQGHEIDSEVLMMAKVSTAEERRIIDFIDELHPYQAPEIFTTPVGSVCIECLLLII